MNPTGYGDAAPLMV